MTKVSVVVPTYRPGDGLDRVVSSLQQQTMPQRDFEVIFVDDGSPDNTWATLQHLRKNHDNVRIAQIENSGWPSRPRNIGIDMAEGEYILFMDHDDALFPDGLRASYEYAVEHESDVLSPKETKTNDIGWGITNYAKNIGNARPKQGIASLFPMMPHKFYRTSFLREHGIRFPEGRRMLWEDIYFNVAAYRNARVISILGNVPVYLWIETASNNSSSYGPRDAEYWEKLQSLFAYIAETLSGEEDAGAREAITAHVYNTRVVGRLWAELGRADGEWIEDAAGRVREILDRYVPERLDRRLPPVSKARAALIRDERWSLIEELRRLDAGWSAKSAVQDLEWRGGELAVTTKTEWTRPDSSPLLFDREGDRYLRSVSRTLREALPDDILDVTEALDRAQSSVLLRDRSNTLTWSAHSTTQTSLKKQDEIPQEAGRDPVRLVLESRARIDFRTVAGGKALTPDVWDVYSRSTSHGLQSIRRVVMAEPASVAIIDGHVAIAYRGKGGQLSLDIGEGLRSLVRSSVVDAESARVTRSGLSTVQIVMPIDGAHIDGEGSTHGRVVPVLGNQRLARAILSDRLARLALVGTLVRRLLTRPVRVRAEGGVAWIEGKVLAVPGRRKLAFRFGRRAEIAEFVLRTPLRGEPTFHRK
ncbi:glycosyltransferase family 2 protein [Pseudactinotalea sp. Z1739]|uniref:glycosyltransferase family 2 protein n=1 Tax=Pseudactinotalea sp. Z1739 TaxID=3413028 RepID=UPI003C7C72CA